MNWPWPRLIQTRWRTLLITEGADGDGRLVEIRWSRAGYWRKEVLLNLGDLDTIAQIDIADFGPFYVVCIVDTDDEHHMLSYYPESGWKEETENVCGIGCNFNGQFIGARDKEVLWSAIGNFDFRPEMDRTAGFRSLFIPNAGGSAKIHKIAQLGKTLVIYANNGRIILNPSVVGNTFAYGEELSYGLGIEAGNHVAGDLRVHGFIDLTGDFWVIQEGGNGPTKRGYREFIRSMDRSKIIVSFLPADKRFYVCDGSACLVINQFGAHHINVMVSGVMYRWDGVIVASGTSTPDTEGRLTTEWLDYGSRGLKSMESLLASMSRGGEKAWLSVDYRMRREAAFKPFRWVTGGPTCEAGIHVTALDFRLKVRTSTFRGVEVDSLLANIKYSDQRFKRGSVPEQRESRTIREALTE